MTQANLFSQPATKEEVPTWRKIRELIRRGAIFVVNHSAGKDSQCMFIRLQRIIPREQLVVVHADLGEVEWHGTIDHIKATIGDTEMYVCRNPNKTLLEMIEARGMFPDASRRQCTSDLKRGPITTQIRRLLKAKGKLLVVNCMGMRAAESDGRECGLTNRKDWKAKQKAGENPPPVTLRLNEQNSAAGREWYDWLPIHKMTTDDVFATIERAGQKPHWAYAAGMTRLSCSFCIMASIGDLKTAAKLRPDMYKRYVELERKLNHTLQMSRKFLPEITGIHP